MNGLKLLSRVAKVAPIAERSKHNHPLVIPNILVLQSMATNPLVDMLGKLNHVAIATPDLEKSSKFYKELGAKVSDPVPQPEHGVYTAFVELPNCKIELLHPYGDKSPIQAFLDKNKDGGMHHICIEVGDIEKAVKSVQDKGIRTLGKHTKIGAHGKPVMFLHPKDCGGVLIELEQE